VKNCPAGALTLVGKHWTAEELVTEACKDSLFFDEFEGGITVSGGEPFMQSAALLELLTMARGKGLHTCVETCGYAEAEQLLEACAATDLFLYDWKLTNDELHRAYTGVSNKKIYENLLLLDEAGAVLRLRCPIIPGVNDTYRDQGLPYCTLTVYFRKNAGHFSSTWHGTCSLSLI
jgi:pyruvate formate lyase activating enzyme